jgi:hypothetical protein
LRSPILSTGETDTAFGSSVQIESNQLQNETSGNENNVNESNTKKWLDQRKAFYHLV